MSNQPTQLHQQAQRGDPKTLTRLLNHVTAQRKITTRVARRDRCLFILFEAEQVPNAREMTAFAQRSLQHFQIQSIDKVKLYGRQRLSQTSWMKEIEWVEPAPQGDRHDQPMDNQTESHPAAPGLESQDPGKEEPIATAIINPASAFNVETNEANVDEANIFELPSNPHSSVPDEMQASGEENAHHNQDEALTSETESLEAFSDFSVPAPNISDAIEAEPQEPAEPAQPETSETFAVQDLDHFVETESLTAALPTAETETIAPDTPASHPLASDITAADTSALTPSVATEEIAETEPDAIEAEIDAKVDAEEAPSADWLNRPESVVLLLFVSVLALWYWYQSIIEEAAPDGSLSGRALARRLSVSPSTISRRRDRSDFEEWSQALDPDGIRWTYQDESFFPNLERYQE